MTVGENLSIKTGKDDDSITVTNTTVGGSRTIDSGKGNDTVNAP